MSSSAVFQRLLLDLWAGILGVPVFSEPGCHRLRIRAGLAVGRPSQRER